MKNQQSGFTLIELIAVIVILGIMAVSALPKFMDLTDAAEQAAVEGVAGNLASAMALNYSGAVAEEAGLTVTPASTVVDTCDDGALLLVGGLNAGYTLSAGALTPLGATAACTLTGLNGVTATFTGIGAP